MHLLRVGVSSGWNNTVQCMADSSSPVCVADGRMFERFVLGQVAHQIELVDLTHVGFGVYVSGRLD